ncbi:MAG: rod shape-determining protein MreC [Blastocatellia bacterium]
MISDNFKRNPLILFIILLVAHWVVLSLNEAPGQEGRRFIQVWVLAVFSPAHILFGRTTGTVGDTWRHYFSLRDMRFENERLVAENAQLKADLINAREAEKRAANLENILNWRKTISWHTVTAQVVGRDANVWFNTVIIDAGTSAGITEGFPVVTPEGLVGRVIQASPLASRVLLLTDERHAAGAIIGQLSESRALGVVKGRSASLCEMKIISDAPKITAGELVVTSGQDGFYPQGIPLGRVSRVETGAGGSYAVDIQPAAPLTRLETVNVLMISREQIRAAMDELNKAERERLEKEKQDKERAQKERQAATPAAR